MRPARLFSILAGALPTGPGWGILFADATDRAVAWAGEPVEIEEDLGRPNGGVAASFHSVRFTVAWSSVRIVAGERRGLLIVSRRYPTGLLRPDLIEFFDLPGSPTRARIHAAASGVAGRLVRLFSEPSDPALLRDDAERARARIPALAAAALWIAFGLAARRLAPSLLLSRLALLLGAPRGESGLWRSLGSTGSLDFGLLATPADVFLTGLLALALLRIAWGDGRRVEWRAPVRLLAGLPLALLPYLLGRAVGELFPDLFTSMDLVPESAAVFFLQSGGLLLATSSVGATALLWSRFAGRLKPGLLLAAGTRSPRRRRRKRGDALRRALRGPRRGGARPRPRAPATFRRRTRPPRPRRDGGVPRRRGRRLGRRRPFPREDEADRRGARRGGRQGPGRGWRRGGAGVGGAAPNVRAGCLASGGPADARLRPRTRSLRPRGLGVVPRSGRRPSPSRLRGEGRLRVRR